MPFPNDISINTNATDLAKIWNRLSATILSTRHYWHHFINIYAQSASVQEIDRERGREEKEEEEEEKMASVDECYLMEFFYV